MKKVLVIGNSWSVRTHLNANIVEGFDRVIRINMAHVDGFERTVGSRRDILAILSSGAPRSFAGAIPHMRTRLGEWGLYSRIWLTIAGPGCKEKMAKAMGISHRKISVISKCNYDNLCELVRSVRETKQTPSTGLTAIYMAMQYFLHHEIWVTGFDQYQSGSPEHQYYWGDREPRLAKGTLDVVQGKADLNVAGHGFDIERQILSDWANQGKIHTIGMPINKPWQAEIPEVYQLNENLEKSRK